MSSLYLMIMDTIFEITFLMHTPVQLNGLLDAVAYEEEYAAGHNVRFAGPQAIGPATAWPPRLQRPAFVGIPT